MSKYEIRMRRRVHCPLNTTVSAGLLLVGVCWGGGLNKSKSIEGLCVWIKVLIVMRSVLMRGDCHADRHLEAIGELEWFYDFTTYAILKQEIIRELMARYSL